MKKITWVFCCFGIIVSFFSSAVFAGKEYVQDGGDVVAVQTTRHVVHRYPNILGDFTPEEAKVIMPNFDKLQKGEEVIISKKIIRLELGFPAKIKSGTISVKMVDGKIIKSPQIVYRNSFRAAILWELIPFGLTGLFFIWFCS